MSGIIILADYPPQGQFIATRLAEIRKNQTWLATQAKTTPSQLSVIMRGKHRPSLLTARSIAKALDVSLDEFANTFI